MLPLITCALLAIQTPGEPTPQQIAEVREAVEKMGGRFEAPLGPEGKRYGMMTLHRATDADLKDLPMVPFAFHLSLGPKVTEEGLAELKRYQTLTELSLRGSNWTGKKFHELGALKNLTALHVFLAPNLGDIDWKPLRQLRVLSVPRAKITGAGLNELQELRTLDISGTKVTEAGLKDVGQLKKLTRLRLDATEVPDAWLKHLAGLDSLANLSLEFTPVTGSGFKDLAGLKHLKILMLTYSQVNDQGLQGVKTLSGLTELRLMHTKVTDAGVGELAVLASLKSLLLDDTAVTTAGVRGLRAVLPDCQIFVNRGRP